MSHPDKVDEQITDSVTQTNTTIIGSGAAMGAMQSYLSQAQAQGILFANMVNEQQQLAVASLATTMECAKSTLSIQEGQPNFFTEAPMNVRQKTTRGSE
ncbi:RebB family R body protein [Thalassospira lucentensis]|uniref:RebB family R body protein n=1 Tax=Thalassospira lucentensis TaxID=168935 RepID=UPI00142E4F13|nr:RebB family R body protein [Thalassospira lucentensis]NIZ03280.1 cobalt transporter ApaG [Thalassospira lucentensis]